MVSVLRAYEQWEADVILCGECWAPNGMAETPRLTQALWNRLIEIQAMRNAALAASPSAVDVPREGDRT